MALKAFDRVSYMSHITPNQVHSFLRTPFEPVFSRHPSMGSLRLSSGIRRTSTFVVHTPLRFITWIRSRRIQEPNSSRGTATIRNTTMRIRFAVFWCCSDGGSGSISVTTNFQVSNQRLHRHTDSMPAEVI